MIQGKIETESIFSPSLLVIGLSCMCTLVQLIALPYNKLAFVSLSNRVLMILWFVVIGLMLLKRFSKTILGETASVLVVIALSMLSWLVAAMDQPSAAVDNLLKTIGFLIFPIMLSYTAFFKIDEKAKTVVFIFAILCSLVFIWLYHSDKCYVYRGPYGIVHLENVTLGYPNPNQTAIYLFLCAMLLFSAMTYFKSLLLKLLMAVDGVYIVWILQKTGSRTAIILFATFAILSFLLRKKEIPGLLIGLALAIPLAYITVIPMLSNMQQGISIMGEDILTGRNQIYDRYFKSINFVSFLFGDLNQFRLANLHNGYVAVAASVGVIACVAYVLCIRTCLKNNRPDESVPVYMRVSFVAIICALVYTSSEAALFVGGSNFAFLLFSPVILFAQPYANHNTAK